MPTLSANEGQDWGRFQLRVRYILGECQLTIQSGSRRANFAGARRFYVSL